MSSEAEKLHFNYHLVDDLVAKAVAIRPLLERNAARHEEIGELVPEVVDALSEAGFFWMAGAERIGGLAIPSVGQAKVVSEIAKGCPSTAWTVSIINSCVWMSSALSFEMQDYIFQDKKNPPRICSPGVGGGTLVPEGDHFILNGRWAYGSGSHHSKFALVPAQSPDGAWNYIALPLADAQIDYTWKVAGMKGTGSDTVVAEAVRVEKHQFTRISAPGTTVSLDVLPDGANPDADKAQQLEATDYWVCLTLLRSKKLGVVLGIVQGLMETVLKTRAKGLSTTTYEHRDESQVFQMGIGKCFARMAAVQSILKFTCELNDKVALEGRVPTVEERMLSRAQVVVGVQLLDEVTVDLMNLCGTMAFAEASNAQRYWRDFTVGSRHSMFAADPSFESVGQWVLGIEPNITPPALF